jgi:hypothetical protein
MGLVSRVLAPEHIDQEADALPDDMLRTSPLGFASARKRSAMPSTFRVLRR